MIETDNGVSGAEFRSVRDLNPNDSTELGQEDFLALLTTQLQNQDPLKPMENGDFIAQIAQFSTVEGVKDLNANFAELNASLVSNQALQATNLVGRSVLAQTGVGALSQGGSISGKVGVPAASSQVTVNVYNEAGEVIRELPLGPQPAGPADFKWDGLKDDGTFAEPGNYFISSEAFIDGENETVGTLIASEVDSVTLSGSGGLLLDLKGIGSLDFSEVEQIL